MCFVHPNIITSRVESKKKLAIEWPGTKFFYRMQYEEKLNLSFCHSFGLISAADHEDWGAPQKQNVNYSGVFR
jgi:hypothetical protein